MFPLKNDKGIALVTALMFTMLSLGIAMTLLYMVTQGVKVTAANKNYKTSLEASYGATELVTKDILPSIFKTYTSAGSLTTVAGKFTAVSLAMPDTNCFSMKTKKSTAFWDTAVCGAASTSVAPSVLPDMTFNLKATNDPTGYRVYAKIVDTRCGGPPDMPCSNADSSGIDYLDSAGGVTGGGVIVSPQPRPAYYKIEVQGERAANPREKSKLSLLYAY